ncbi:MAG: DHH family phosphoesterase [Mycoplasmatales bacterium]
MVNKKILIFSLTFLIILSFLFIKTNNLYIFVLINIFIYLYVYFTIREFYLKRKEQDYIKEQIKVAKEDIFNTENVIIFIIRKNKIVWANDNGYEHFPTIKQKRNATFLIENSDNEEEILKYNNKIYKVLAKGEIYFLLEITTDYRKQQKLQQNQTIIGFFQIDNMQSIQQSMDTLEFSKFKSQFEQQIFKMFIENKVFYKQIDDKTFYLNYPYSYLQKCIKDRFLDIGEIIKEYHDQNIVITTTMGIAYNYQDISKAGKKAQEALELAISRGGAQIVIFDDDEKYYYGGGFVTTKGSHRLRARIINNTLIRTLHDKDIIYLMTHKNPDYDAIASILLIYTYLKKENIEVKIILDNEKSLLLYDLDDKDFAGDIITSYVIDNTKKNILMVLDTQSKDIVSHPEILEELNEVIIIDHHQTPANYFRGNIFSWIEPNASSTTELIMSILIVSNRLQKGAYLNNLGILGILTDTNKFKYRTSYQTLDALMHLTEQGGDLVASLKSMYLPKEQFLKKQKLLNEISFLGKFALVEIEEKIDDILLSIVADELTQMKDIEGSIVISVHSTEEEFLHKYQVKIRTTNKISAKSLIEEYGGGGHFLQAAGILNYEQKEALKEKIENLLDE